MKRFIQLLLCASIIYAIPTTYAGGMFSCCTKPVFPNPQPPYMPLTSPKPSTSTYPAPTVPMPKFVISRDVPLPIQLTY
jgi:hypothetical protein